MSSTLSRVLIATALLAAGTADALAGRRVVVLDFDGPRTLADSGRDAVVRALGADNDIIAQKRWLDAKAEVTRTQPGPKKWPLAARRAGVDVVIEGWVQNDNRTKVLTVVVTDAANGHEFDQLTIKLPNDGVINETTLRALRKELEDRIEWIESTTPRGGLEKPGPDKPETAGEGPQDPVKLGGEPKQPLKIGPEPATPETEAKPAPTETATASPAPGITVLAPTEPVDWLPEQPKRISRPTPRARVAGGFGWRSRSLAIGAENQEGVQDYAGVPDKYLAVDAAFYPFPKEKRNGQLQGVGFSFGVNQSLGSTVTFDDLEEVGEYSIDSHGWNAAVHYRKPVGSYFAVDGEVGYGRQTYNIQDAPETFEVPNTSYHALHVGGHVDLSVTDRATVGFGGKYFHVLESGDLSSVDWYGPGRTSGLALDASFVIPLPAKLFVRGDFVYSRFKTSFDGAGIITEEEGAFEAVDSTVGITAKVGIDF